MWCFPTLRCDGPLRIANVEGADGDESDRHSLTGIRHKKIPQRSETKIEPEKKKEMNAIELPTVI